MTSTTETTTAQTAIEIVNQYPNALAMLGDAANAAAAGDVFMDYRLGKSDNTLKAHDQDLAQFAAFLSQAVSVNGAALCCEPSAWNGVTWGLIEAFKRWLLSEGYSIGTINRTLSTVKKYAQLAFKAGSITADQYALIRTVQGYSGRESVNVDKKRRAAGGAIRRQRAGVKKSEHVSLADDDATRLKNDHPNTPQGRRDAVLMGLLLDLGLRCGEVALLTVDTLDLKAGYIKFNRPKVHKEQTHQLPKSLLRALRAAEKAGELLPAGALVRGSTREYQGKDKDGKPYTRPGKLQSKGMSERAITQRVNVLGQRIGVHGLSAHDCRHYWATKESRKNNPFALQEAGGWNSLAMPRRYTESAKVANAALLADGDDD